MSRVTNQASLLFGSQLFHRKYRVSLPEPYVLIEADDLCDFFRFHKQKIYTYLASMRSYRDELVSEKVQVCYRELLPDEKRVSFFDQLTIILEKLGTTELHVFEIEDKWVERKLQDYCGTANIQLVVHASPQFVFSKTHFQNYLGGTKRPFMKTFYEQGRKQTGLLMAAEGKPLGGQYSFDEDNRKKLKKGDPIPQGNWQSAIAVRQDVHQLVLQRFSSHPGACEQLWAPTSRREALAVFDSFIGERAKLFGDFEDAITFRSDFLYHSGLSTALNMGWLTPMALLNAFVKNAAKIPLNSQEGFVRQVLGWREFVRGIYQNFSEQQESTNFFANDRKLTPHWYEGTTGIEPLDFAIKKVLRLGYNHHIERLMVICNLMNLLGVHPQEVHRWFMEMYVDSADWVMGPNVYGMGLMSDGGIFATKPYICGSNYFFKMSDELTRGPWCDEVDGLYWQFISKHQTFFKKNPRLSMMSSLLDKMPKEKRHRLFTDADQVRNRITLPK